MNTSQTIFSVTRDDLDRLNPEEAVTVFHELLWVEATALGIGKNLIEVPGAINDADGGIDAQVKYCPGGGQGLIKEGLTRYQIKTGGDFKPTKDSDLKSILFNKHEVLKERVKSCFEKGGTLVLVLFGWDGAEREDDQIVNKLRGFLTGVVENPANVKIEMCQQSTIIGYLKPFPSLALRVNRREHAIFQTHRSWSGDAEMMRLFKMGKAEEEWIKKVQTELRKHEEAVHIRILGEAGIGKTRLTLETTDVEDLRPLVVYCDTPSKFLDGPLLNEILRDDSQINVVLVIDECDKENRARIWDKLKHRGPRIKLITIYNEWESVAAPTMCFEAPKLSVEVISAIIQGYGTPKDDADRWAQQCGESPRVAHVIGQNLKDYPDDLLKSPDTVDVWERYIAGHEASSEEQVRQRRVVLLHVALFKRVGYDGPCKSEAQAIAKIVERVDRNITQARFLEIVKELRSRRILQGEYTLYISPGLFHVWLWREYWETYATSFELEEFSKGMPESLFEWFYEMWRYAAGSPASARIVKELLSAPGPFRDGVNLKTKLGADFFLALTEADPSSALACLKRTLGNWSRDELSGFREGRREIVWALERIVVWKPLFADGARLLLALGEAENESCSNNASGTFADLFTPGMGQVAPTEAPPEERFPVLVEALTSASQDRRLLGLRACGTALETRSFTRMIGAEYQGLRQKPLLWRPKVWGEVFDAYRRVWNYLWQHIDTFTTEERNNAARILLGHARGLVQIQNLSDMVIDTLGELAKKPWMDPGEVLATVIEVLHYETKDLPQDTVDKLRTLKDELTGSDYPSLLKRYVGMDVFEDNFDEEGNQVDQTKSHIEDLVRQTMREPSLLDSQWHWLLTNEAKNGYSFGYEVGKADAEFKLLPKFLQAQSDVGEKGTPYFLGGYFRALYEGDPKRWEEVLDDLCRDPELRRFAPELTWRSGMSDQAAQRILDLAQSGSITVESFAMFRFGGTLKGLTGSVFDGWNQFLVNQGTIESVAIALDLFHSYYIYGGKGRVLPKELTLQLLLADSLFDKGNKVQRFQGIDYNWKEIALAFIRQHEGEALKLSEKLLKFFGTEETIVGMYRSPLHKVLVHIAKRYPIETWGNLTAYLGPPIDTRAFHLREWLREGSLSVFPVETIWAWVDGDLEQRTWYLATFVPKGLFRSQERVCLARELLVRYGHIKEVRENFSANYWSGSWSGPQSLHLEQVRAEILKFKDGEENENVIRWIDEYLKGMDRDLERAKIQEERDDF